MLTLWLSISLAILLAYCIITIGHITYTVWTGISSTAWDSVPEVVALALNSPPRKEMENTCAGIKTAQVFEHRIHIAAIECNEEQGGSTNADRTVTNERTLAMLFSSVRGLASSDVKISNAYGGSGRKAFD